MQNRIRPILFLLEQKIELFYNPKFFEAAVKTRHTNSKRLPGKYQHVRITEQPQEDWQRQVWKQNKKRTETETRPFGH